MKTPIKGSKKETPKNTPSLETWLLEHRYIQGAINWFDGKETINYQDWSGRHKTQLQAMFDRLVNGQAIGLDEAMPLEWSSPTSPVVSFTISEGVAWDYYLAHVAQSLYVECYNVVPWSLMDLSIDQIRNVLDGSFFYSIFPGDTLIRISSDEQGSASYGDPSRVFRFLESNNLIGSNQRDTISRVVRWCKKLFHFSGSFSAENVYKHWQYYGFPPVERIINKTVNADLSDDLRHYTAGCHGTTGFLRILLKTLNIPVAVAHGGNHTVPHFMSLDLYLSHGDDPYDGHIDSNIPPESIFIDATKFNYWFSHQFGNNNVGRQPVELAVKYISYKLLKYYCKDVNLGTAGPRNYEESQIFILLGDYFSAGELEASNLWLRMESKLVSIGGCSKLELYL